jgi:hypothetical protein
MTFEVTTTVNITNRISRDMTLRHVVARLVYTAT